MTTTYDRMFSATLTDIADRLRKAGARIDDINACDQDTRMEKATEFMNLFTNLVSNMRLDLVTKYAVFDTNEGQAPR